MAKDAKTKAKERLEEAEKKFQKAREGTDDKGLVEAGHDVAVAEFFAEEAGLSKEEIDEILERP